MRGFTYKAFIAATIVCGAASAQAFQFGTFSHGTFTIATIQDLETVDFAYFNGHAPITLTTFALDGNTNTGFLAGPGNTDRLNFSFTVDNTQTLGSQVNQEAHWVAVNGTGAFSGLTGIGSFSIDFTAVDNNTAQTATGLTGELHAVPEPATYAALGLGALALVRRRTKRSA